MVVQGLPRHLRKEDVVKMLGPEYGVLVGVELPMRNIDQQKPDNNQKDIENEIEMKRASKVVEESYKLQQADV